MQPGEDPRWNGPFYTDPRNPALFVRKRYGFGWTINLGHPWGRPLLVALFLIPVAAVVVISLLVR